MNPDDLDPKRIAQIRRELENYSTEQLTEIWRRHDLEEWTEEAFAAIRQILAARPAAQLPAQEELALSGDHLERANQYGEAGRVQEALGELERAIQENPDSLEAYQYRGNLLEELGDLEGAIQAYRKARYINRSDESTRLDLRRALGKQFERVALKRQAAEEAEAEETDEAEEIDEETAEEEAEEAAIDNEPVEYTQSEPARPLPIPAMSAIGLATAWVSITGIIFGLIVITHLQDFLSGNAGGLFDFASASDKNILLFSGLLWLGLLAFYMRQLFNNDDIRISLFGLISASFIILPFISMPVYFYIYIWRANLDNPG
jgi:tetratricopeptide (TPR) repeat protein